MDNARTLVLLGIHKNYDNWSNNIKLSQIKLNCLCTPINSNVMWNYPSWTGALGRVNVSRDLNDHVEQCGCFSKR